LEKLTEKEKYEMEGVYKSKGFQAQNAELARVKKEPESAKV
jgi:hypothetical protein